MNEVKVSFEFTCDNAQLAQDEIEVQVKNLGLDVKDIRITDSIQCEKTEEDWFDDYIFTVAATVFSDAFTCSEIKEMISNGGFESYEFDS